MRPGTRKAWGVAVILTVVATAASSVALPVPAPAPAGDAAPRGDAAIDATLVDAAGKAVQLSDWRGRRALVLLFMRGFTGEFACFHCSHQIAAWKEAYARVQAAGAEVIAVLPGAKSPRGFLGKVAEVLDDKSGPEYAVPFPVLADPDFSACRAFLVNFDPRPDAFPFPVSEPATAVLDRDGRLVYVDHGSDPSDRPKVDPILDVLLHGPPPATEIHRKFATPPAAPGEAPPASNLPWKSYADGMALARAQGQPVLLDFHALW
jgi:peroxiredoxin